MMEGSRRCSSCLEQGLVLSPLKIGANISRSFIESESALSEAQRQPPVDNVHAESIQDGGRLEQRKLSDNFNPTEALKNLHLVEIIGHVSDTEMNETEINRRFNSNNMKLSKKLNKPKGLQALQQNLTASPAEDDPDPGDSAYLEAAEEAEEMVDDVTKQKIKFALKNAIVNQVKSLNGESLGRYLELIETQFPCNLDDWHTFVEQSKQLINTGPRLKISSLVINTENDKLKKKKLRAELYFSEVPSSRIQTEFQENDINVVFNNLGELLTPGLEDPLLRIDILKPSKKTSSGEKVVCSAAKRMSEIVCNQPVYVLLEEKNLGVLNSSIHSYSPAKSNILLTACLENDEIHANQSLPNLLNQMLLKHTSSFIDFTPLTDDADDEYNSSVYYEVYVRKHGGSSSTATHNYIKEGSESSKSSEVGLQCVLTDKIEFKSRDRSPSPNPSNPTRPVRISLGDLINGVSRQEGRRVVEVLELADLKPRHVDLENSRWEAGINLNSTVMLTVEEFASVYRKVLVKETCSSWDGTIQNSTRTILRILEQFTSATEEDVRREISLAYLAAHNVNGFSQAYLTDNIAFLSRLGGGTDGEPVVDTYLANCLKVIKNMRSFSREEVKRVVDNLAMFGPSEEIKQKVCDALRSEVDIVFQFWLEESRKELRKEAKVYTKEGRDDWYSQKTDMEVMTKLLNDYIYPDVYKESLEYIEVFAPLDINFRLEIGDEYINKTVQIIETYLWSKEEISAFLDSITVFNEEDNDIEYFQQSYNCYCVLRKVYALVDTSSNRPADLFRDYSEAWLSLGIQKAKVQLRRLTSQAKHDEKMTSSHSALVGSTQRQHSEEDPVVQQLLAFHGISESCWKLWEDLSYPDTGKELECCIKLINGLNNLEKLFLDEKEKLYLDDEILEVNEMVKLVRLLDGLKDRYVMAGDKLNSILMKIDNDERDDAINQRIAEAYPKLEEMKGSLDDEIKEKMMQYARGFQPKFQSMILDKRENKLTSEESVLTLLDTEMMNIHKNFQKTKDERRKKKEQHYTMKACLILWNVFEHELLEHFKKKKTRNQEKNKPSRFDFLKEGIEYIIQCKTIAIQSDIMENSDFDDLNSMLDELKQLTKSTTQLINEVLRMKEEEEDEEGEEEVDPIINYHLGYIRGRDRIAMEIRSIRNLNMEGKEKIGPEFRATFFPPRVGDTISVHDKKGYIIDQSSWVFDTSEENDSPDRLLFTFPLDHQSKAEESFICIDLVDKPHSLLLSHFIGDAVFKVCKNGTVLPDIQEFESLDEFLKNTYFSQKRFSREGSNVYQSRSFLELRERRDDLAKSFNKWQNKDKIKNAEK